jgi:hypothetical protein
MQGVSTRIGGHWLVLTPLEEYKWRLQVWGATPLEAEVTAEDETAAKDTAIAATIERLRILRFSPLPTWNAVITSRWDSRERRTNDHRGRD